MSYSDGTIQVPYAQLEAAQAELKRANDTIEAALADLKAKLDILQQQWKGQTQQAYTQAKAQWDARMNKMNAVLPLIHQSITTAAETYQQMDRQGAGLFGA